MPVNDEERNKEAFEVGDLIHSAANIVEQAIRMEDQDSKKALQKAAKTLLQKAIARLDESVGASDADEDDE
jgi:RNA polymerase-interacting CarD/CdnL/TRCF family regulator